MFSPYLSSIQSMINSLKIDTVVYITPMAIADWKGWVSSDSAKNGSIARFKANAIGIPEPLLKVCLIQRLSTIDSLKLLEEHGFKMSDRKFYSLKKEYNSGTTKRFLEIAKTEWANEHLLILDKLKDIEKRYYELFEDCETATEAKNVLDSLRALQQDITLFYNETPLIAKMKETLEAKLEGLNGKK